MSNHDKGQDYLINWYADYPGYYLLQVENQLLDEALPSLFGYYLLQLGPLKTHYTLKNNRTLNTLYQNQLATPTDKADLYGLYTQMPYANSSVDTVFLPHIVENEADIQHILEESIRVLIPDGYLIISSFNPCSLLGVWNFIRCCLRKPSLGRCKTIDNVCRHLHDVNAEVITIKSSFFRPLIKNRRWMSRLKFLEVLGRICFPKMGGVYVIVAQKKVIPLSPIKLDWKRQLSSLGKEIASPTTRSCNRDKTC